MNILFLWGRSRPRRRVGGVDALVHCAWDFRAALWKQIHAVNVEGSLRVFEAAKEAGVKRLVYISTMSAFVGCRSLYGKAKLEIEKRAASWGVDIVRPGLVYGPHPGGMVGFLANISKLPILPLVGTKRNLLFLAFEEDLGKLVVGLCRGSIAHQDKPVIAAHQKGLTLKEILRLLAKARGKKVVFVPVPWRLAWSGLKLAELFGLRIRLRSDGLVGMMNLETDPDFEASRATKVTFREFDPKLCFASPRGD